MIKNGLSEEFTYEDTIFAGSIGMMAREYASEWKIRKHLNFNRLRRTGPVFDAYVTEEDRLRQAAAARVPVFDISGANAEKQGGQYMALTKQFLARCA
jgi:chromosome partitioning protein